MLRLNDCLEHWKASNTAFTGEWGDREAGASLSSLEEKLVQVKTNFPLFLLCDNFITIRYFVTILITIRYFVTVPVISLSLSTVFLSLFIILEFQVFLQSAINSNLSFIHFQQWIDLLIVEKGYFQFLRYIPFPSLIKILNFPHYSNILRASWYMWSFLPSQVHP